jgi:DNA-binding LytR/AlgR family response regulator
MKIYQQKGDHNLLIINHKTSKKIPISDVILLKGNINYTTFCLRHGREKFVPRSIKFFEEHLETLGFLRVHRSFMINPLYVEKYDEDKDILTMTNGYEATISRRRKHTIKNLK